MEEYAMPQYTHETFPIDFKDFNLQLKLKSELGHQWNDIQGR